MTLQKKNKLLIILLLLVLSSCSTEFTQEIFKDGTSKILIVSELQEDFDYCPKFQRNTQLYDKICTQNERTLNIEGTYYIESQNLEYEEGIFISKYTYDTQSIYPLLNSLVNLQNPLEVIGKEDTLDVRVKLKMPGFLRDHSFQEEDNLVLFSKSEFDSTRDKSVNSVVYHPIPILILVIIIVIIIIASIIIVKKIKTKNSSVPNIVLNEEISIEEKKCRQYVLQFKNQYSREILFQGLINSGIPQDRAQYYINKYMVSKN